MQQTIRFSIATIAALALALAVSLSGCATTHSTSPERSAAPTKSGLVGKAARNAPSAGSCWRGAAQHGVPQVDWYVWDQGAEVNCSRAHQLYTVAVLPLPGPLPTEEFPQGQIDSDIYVAAEQACVTYIKKNVGSPDAQNGLFEYKAYLPSQSDWTKGARWARCDLTVFKVGSLVSFPELEDLPTFATLKRQLASHEFDLCTNVPGGTVAAGPRATGAVFASCSGDPQWTYFHYFGDEAANPSYPTPAEFAAQFDGQCAPFGAASGAHTVPWYPTAEQWADGDHGFECWGTSQ